MMYAERHAVEDVELKENVVATNVQPARPWLAFSLAAIAQLMIVLDVSIINVALPSISKGLKFAPTDLQWVVNIYVLMFGGFLLLGGRAGDLYGLRRLFMGGMAVFILASFAGGLAQSPGWLITARAIQGLGGAVISPVALAIVSSSFAEGPKLNMAVGIYGSLAGLGAVLGVLLGGILTSGLGWRWVMFVNVPIGVVVLLLSPLFIPRSEGKADAGTFDVLGAVSITAALCLIVYAVVKAPDNGWGSATTLGLFAVAVVLLIAFIVTEQRSAAPLVRLGIFRNRTLSVANVLGFLTGLVLFGMFYFLSLYTQEVLGFSALKTGLAFLPLAVVVSVGAGVASGLVTRYGFKYIIAIGMTLTTIGLLFFLGLPVTGSYTANLLPGMLIVAAGLGFIYVPLPIAGTTGVVGNEIGLASGLINATQQIGGAIGLAALATIATSRFNNVIPVSQLKVPPLYLPCDQAQLYTVGHLYGACASATVDSYHYAFAASAVVLAIGVVLAFVLLPSPKAAPVLAADTAAAKLA
jgi:EmrB/QacA subfamily drug resistance transporter